VDGSDPGRRRRFETPAEPIGDIIQRLFRRGRLSRESEQLTELQRCWSDVVGGDMADELTPFRVRDGVVWVRVSSPTLFFEMCNFGARAVLDRLDEMMPGRFSDVRFCQ